MQNQKKNLIWTNKLEGHIFDDDGKDLIGTNGNRKQPNFTINVSVWHWDEINHVNITIILFPVVCELPKKMVND